MQGWGCPGPRLRADSERATEGGAEMTKSVLTHPEVRLSTPRGRSQARTESRALK